MLNFNVAENRFFRIDLISEGRTDGGSVAQVCTETSRGAIAPFENVGSPYDRGIITCQKKMFSEVSRASAGLYSDNFPICAAESVRCSPIGARVIRDLIQPLGPSSCSLSFHFVTPLR
jgi:hypothetical protein